MMRVLLSLIILTLCGCNTGQYQQYQSGVGYQSEQQADNVFQVSYTGSRTTKFEKVNDFVLLRSAELTREKGYNYFVIEKAVNNDASVSRTKSMAAKSMSGTARSARPGPGSGDMSPITGEAAKSELTIHCFTEKPEGISYDARMIERTLKQEYEISTQNSP